MIARASRNMDSYEWKIWYRHLPAPQNMHDYTDCTFSQAAEQMIEEVHGHKSADYQSQASCGSRQTWKPSKIEVSPWTNSNWNSLWIIDYLGIIELLWIIDKNMHIFKVSENALSQPFSQSCNIFE